MNKKGKDSRGKGSPKTSSFYLAWELLNGRDRTRIFWVLQVQIILGFMDLLGIAAIGLLGSLTLSGIQSNQPGQVESQILAFIGLQDTNFQLQVALLAITATALFIGRTVTSVYFTRRTLFFLSHKGAKASSDLMSKFMSQSLLFVHSRSSQKTLFSITQGVETLMLGIIGTSITVIADLALVLTLSVGLFLVDPLIPVMTLVLTATVGTLLYQLLVKRAQLLGAAGTKVGISLNERILEALKLFRETTVRNRQSYYVREVRRMNNELSEILAESAFLPYISKYVIESALILAAVLFCAIQFFLQDATQAITNLTLFIAATARIAPAVLRLQQGMMSIRGNVAASKPTLDLISDLQFVSPLNEIDEEIINNQKGFQPNIMISKVSFKYPLTSNFALSDFSLEIKAGESVALVGPTGAGKSTAVDVLLGLLEPESGKVLISDVPPKLALSKWPGAIAYVPQEVIVLNGTIRENVAQGFDCKKIDDDDVWSALTVANLESHVRSLRDGLDSPVGEYSTNLSGGQKQRLGIARALFTRPKLLVLDEATSSLDAETEKAITEAIEGLKGKVTVVTIAHRLSTVLKSDKVIYMERGRTIASGSFEEVLERVPNFRLQANLMRLN